MNKKTLLQDKVFDRKLPGIPYNDMVCDLNAASCVRNMKMLTKVLDHTYYTYKALSYVFLVLAELSNCLKHQ